MRSGKITTFKADGILGETVQANVIDEGTAGSVHSASVVVPVLRCRVWGLLHGYGWLLVQ